MQVRFFKEPITFGNLTLHMRNSLPLVCLNYVTHLQTQTLVHVVNVQHFVWLQTNLLCCAEGNNQFISLFVETNLRCSLLEGKYSSKRLDSFQLNSDFQKGEEEMYLYMFCQSDHSECTSRFLWSLSKVLHTP